MANQDTITAEIVNDILHRPRLIQRVKQALRQGHVLISAPCGYGKTVLLRSLAAHLPHTYYISLTHTTVSIMEGELAAPPSPLSEWLAERLRLGEEI